MAEVMRPASFILLLTWAIGAAGIGDQCPITEAAADLDDVSLVQLSLHTHKNAPVDPQKGTLHANQNFEVTYNNRYPAVFKGMWELLTNNGATPQKPVKLMSFGCSDGSEVRTLRVYFPGAIIHGLDVDPQMIAQNTNFNQDPSTQYFSSATNLEEQSYDAIVALSVLCRQQTEQDHLPFAEFVQSLDLMDSLVKPGGYIVLYNTDVPFSLYTNAHRYQPMAQGCPMANTVEFVQSPGTFSADQRPQATPWGLRALPPEGIGQPTGQCAQSGQTGQYCIESGWRWKFDDKGNILQPHGTNTNSFGCMHPGTFFKRL